jgi:hypothetical protein
LTGFLHYSFFISNCHRLYWPLGFRRQWGLAQFLFCYPDILLSFAIETRLVLQFTSSIIWVPSISKWIFRCWKDRVLLHWYHTI